MNGGSVMKRKWLWLGVAAVALAFLYLPTLGIGGGQLLAFLLVLLCPLMHFFMGHGSHGHGSQAPRDSGGVEATPSLTPSTPAQLPPAEGEAPAGTTR